MAPNTSACNRLNTRSLILLLSLYKTSICNAFHFGHDDGGSTFLWNVGTQNAIWETTRKFIDVVLVMWIPA
jgi:hypothetical protein